MQIKIEFNKFVCSSVSLLMFGRKSVKKALEFPQVNPRK